MLEITINERPYKMSIEKNYTGENMEKRIGTLEKTIFGGDKPQDSLVSLVHSTNKLIQDFVENDKKAKKQIILFLVASIGATITCIFAVGYKSAEFDTMKHNIVDIQARMSVIESRYHEKHK